MMGAFTIAGLIALVFYAGSLWPHPSAMLLAGAAAACAGVIVARIQRDMDATRLISDHLQVTGKTLTLKQFNQVAVIGPGEDLTTFHTMPVYLAAPDMKAITSAFTCRLAGRRVLVLEHDALEAAVLRAAEEVG